MNIERVTAQLAIEYGGDAMRFMFFLIERDARLFLYSSLPPTKLEHLLAVVYILSIFQLFAKYAICIIYID